jgi:hypothetical protein
VTTGTPNYYHPRLAHETPAQVAQRLMRLERIEYERRCLCVTLMAAGIKDDAIIGVTAPLTRDLTRALADCRHRLRQFAEDRTATEVPVVDLTEAERERLYDDPHWSPF